MNFPIKYIVTRHMKPSSMFKGTKATSASSSFLLAAKEKDIIVWLRKDCSVLTSSRTDGAATVD